MAQEDRTFDPSRAATNRARMQGNGVGQTEMNQQRDPNRYQTATDPERTEAFDTDLEAAGGGDRGAPQAGRRQGGEGEGEESPETRDRWRLDPQAGRDDVDLQDAGDLGAGTPAGVDVHDLGQEDNPEEDWGEAAAEGTMHSSNHNRRGVRTEAERGQGKQTRKLNKDIVSRRT